MLYVTGPRNAPTLTGSLLTARDAMRLVESLREWLRCSNGERRDVGLESLAELEWAVNEHMEPSSAGSVVLTRSPGRSEAAGDFKPMATS